MGEIIKSKYLSESFMYGPTAWDRLITIILLGAFVINEKKVRVKSLIHGEDNKDTQFYKKYLTSEGRDKVN